MPLSTLDDESMSSHSSAYRSSSNQSESCSSVSNQDKSIREYDSEEDKKEVEVVKVDQRTAGNEIENKYRESTTSMNDDP